MALIFTDFFLGLMFLRDFCSFLLANWRLLKLQMVSQIALMVATILLFWCSEQKIVHPAGKRMAELPEFSLQKKSHHF